MIVARVLESLGKNPYSCLNALWGLDSLFLPIPWNSWNCSKVQFMSFRGLPRSPSGLAEVKQGFSYYLDGVPGSADVPRRSSMASHCLTA